ncbi:hypothetical protein OIU85_021811 [Salix viminalis]|uniref:Uncharacterized protein n=1 Tax=Salix viminalis TaxID=40686 RepID=A0A9Q0UJN9_SALVM|nr:hypothetical protein OIU85_021811 [Salix viminalis]
MDPLYSRAHHVSREAEISKPGAVVAPRIAGLSMSPSSLSFSDKAGPELTNPMFPSYYTIYPGRVTFFTRVSFIHGLLNPDWILQPEKIKPDQIPDKEFDGETFQEKAATCFCPQS